MKGRENTVLQVIGYMDVKNAKEIKKIGSEHQLHPSSFKVVTIGAAISKNASVRISKFKIMFIFRMHK
jgi:hypothetical protein